MNENVPSTPPREGGADSQTSLMQIVRGWLRGLARPRNSDATLLETLEGFIEKHAGEDVAVDPEERAMLVNLLNFGDLRVDDVMVPRADLVAAEESSSLTEVVNTMREAGHSRLPVFRDTLDDILGMVHVRDLLRMWGSDKPFALREFTRRVLFVPPSMQIRVLLLQMRAARIHMAIVVDEYGGTDGLVTIEDLVEEIVGEIEDEHDVAEAPKLVDKPGGLIEADARVAVDDLEARVGYSLLPDEHDESVDTLGGLVFSLVGRVPSRGELIAHPDGLQFEVVDADPRRIKRLRIHNAPPAPEPSPK